MTGTTNDVFAQWAEVKRFVNRSTLRRGQTFNMLLRAGLDNRAHAIRAKREPVYALGSRERQMYDMGKLALRMTKAMTELELATRALLDAIEEVSDRSEEETKTR